MAACSIAGDAESNPGAEIVVEALVSGVWTLVATIALTPPTMPTSLGQSYSVVRSGTATFAAPVDSCEIRAFVRFSGVSSTPTNTGTRLAVSLTLTDLRLVATDTGDDCTGSGGSGGVPPGGGGDEDENCVYAEDGASVCTYAEDAATTCGYSEE